MTPDTVETISVLCVDDNPLVADALRIKFARTAGIVWKGWVSDAECLAAEVLALRPLVVLLDLELPGKDPLEAMAEIVLLCPETRIVIFSGHVRRALIDRAIEMGAWGYAAKNDGEDALIDVIRHAARGEFALSPQVRAAAG